MKALLIAFAFSLYLYVVFTLPTYLLGHAPIGMEVIDVMLVAAIFPMFVFSVIALVRQFRG